MSEPVAGVDADRPGEVVRHCGEGGPGSICGKAARGQVRQRTGLQIGDHLLDDGVPAVVGLQVEQVTVPIGDERVGATRGRTW